MERSEVRRTLEALAAGAISVEEADAALRTAGSVDLGFANVDVDRARRRGVPEVIFGMGKTPEQIADIARVLFGRGQRVLATRVDPEKAAAVLALLAGLPVRYEVVARCICVEDAPAPDLGRGEVLVIAAGTSDLPVAEEAVVTLRMCGNRVSSLYDVGVAGLHRLLGRLDRVRSASVLIVVAGMEGALPSVVGGLVARPVIAVPTSVGYGANLGGVAALLGMLNSCASGVTVVNIDNGFGAGFAASLMNRREDVA
jgi:NCAIR mutase (PurE)-related protein